MKGVEHNDCSRFSRFSPILGTTAWAPGEEPGRGGVPHTVTVTALIARDLDSNATASVELRLAGLIHILLEDRYLHQKLPWNLILHNVAQTNDTPETLFQGQ